MSVRQALIVTHRWVALIVGAILCATAISGATLVFEGAIDRGLHPALWRVTPAGAPLPVDTLVARVEKAFPGSAVTSVGLSAVPDRAWTMNAGPVAVFVNPYTGAINGTRTPEESRATLARRLHVFHVELFGGKIGREIVGASTIAGFFLVVTGIFLWWPDKLIRVRTSASWKRINFDFHHAVGILASLILLIVTASGLVIHYEALTRAVKSLDATPAQGPPSQPAGSAGTGAVLPGFDAVVATARNALPGAEVTSVFIGSAKSPAVVAMRFASDRTPGGRSRVYVSHYSGQLLAVVSTRDAQLGTRLDNLKRSLHTGDVLGKPTEFLWLLATLAMASQFLTGVLMWWNARRGRRV